jgi:hypothetical protein
MPRCDHRGAAGNDNRIRHGWLEQAFSVRHDFADAWYRFLNPAADATSQTLELPIDASYFPYRFQRSDIRISAISLYLLPKEGADTTDER